MKVIEPAGHRVLVQSDPAEKTSAGGIILTQKTVTLEQNSTETGTVLAIGPTAYAAYDGLEAWGLEIGDEVVFARHGGKVVEPDGHDSDADGVMRIVNDIDIVGIFRSEGA